MSTLSQFEQDAEEAPEQHDVPSLPPDVVALAFDCLREEVYQSQAALSFGPKFIDVEALLRIGYSCCLVSRAFLPHGRSLLYSNLGLGHLKTSAGQLDVVLKNSHLAETVKVWELNLGKEYDCMEIAKLLPRLTTIVYHSRDYIEQNPEGCLAHIDSHLAQPFPALRSHLRCQRLVPYNPHSSEMICAAINAYTHLEALSIQTAITTFPDGAPHSLAHLRSLDITLCDKHFFADLLVASPNLKSLKMAYSDSDSSSSAESNRYLPAPSSLYDHGLRELIVHLVRRVHSDPALAEDQTPKEAHKRLFAFIASFSALTSLEIIETGTDDDSSERVPPPADEACHEFLRTLPESLEILSVYGRHLHAFALSLPQALQIALAGTSSNPAGGGNDATHLPRLKSLSVSWGQEYKVQPFEWYPLFQSCEDHNIAISGSLAVEVLRQRVAQAEQAKSLLVREESRRKKTIFATSVTLLVSAIFSCIISFYLEPGMAYVFLAVALVELIASIMTSAPSMLDLFYGSILEACRLEKEE